MSNDLSISGRIRQVSIHADPHIPITKLKKCCSWTCTENSSLAFPDHQSQPSTLLIPLTQMIKSHSHLATRLGSFGLCTSRASSRPAVHSIPSHNTASSRYVSHAVSISRSGPIRVKLGSIHQHQHHLQSTIVRHISAMPSAKFSPGSEGPVMEAALTDLLAEGGSGRWTLTADGQGIERNFKFKTFTKTWVCPSNNLASLYQIFRRITHPIPYFTLFSRRISCILR